MDRAISFAMATQYSAQLAGAAQPYGAAMHSPHLSGGQAAYAAAVPLNPHGRPVPIQPQMSPQMMLHQPQMQQMQLPQTAHLMYPQMQHQEQLYQRYAQMQAQGQTPLTPTLQHQLTMQQPHPASLAPAPQAQQSHAPPQPLAMQTQQTQQTQLQQLLPQQPNTCLQ